MGPIDYTSAQATNQDFLRSLQGGLQLGAGIQAIQQQQAAQDLAQQRAVQYQADAAAFQQNPTAQGALALSLKYPDQAKPITDAFGAYTGDQQKVELRDAATLTNLLHANRADLATQEIDKRIEAAKNTGLSTNQLKALKSVIENDPKAALAHSLTIMAALPGGKDVLSNLQSVNKDARDQSESDVKVAGGQAENTAKNLGIVGQTAGALAKPGVKPAQAITMFKSLEARGILPKGGAQDYIDNMPSDPAALPDYLKQVQAAGMKPDDQMKFTTPDANAQLSARTQVQTTGMNNATQLAVQDHIDARNKDDSNVTLGIKGLSPEQNSALFGPNGAVTTGRLDPNKINSKTAAIFADAEMLTPGTNFARTSSEINRGRRGDVEFSIGKSGNAIRSFNVGISHLDTLGGLADALGNKDTQAINRIGNAFATQTGKPAPTNFQGAKKIVGDEIVKAIVGAGGGVADREEAQKIFDAANSPAQLKGAVKTVQELMIGQLGGLQQQYRDATGRADFVSKLTPRAQALQQQHGGTPAGPAVGTIDAGFRFKGGDPSQKSNWEPVR